MIAWAGAALCVALGAGGGSGKTLWAVMLP